jgi:hypothetical protein
MIKKRTLPLSFDSPAPNLYVLKQVHRAQTRLSVLLLSYSARFGARGLCVGSKHITSRPPNMSGKALRT